MRVGVLGLGSMGSRRVRDLIGQGHEVLGYDVRADRMIRASERFGIEVVPSMDELFRAGLEALVISTPPDVHAECYRAAFDARVPFFSEANVLTPTADWFAAQESLSGVKGYPSATWRFYAPLVALAERVRCADFRALTVHHEYADFLPHWHPWENYWDFYAGARRQTCAAREMVPFEFEWLYWLFGAVTSVTADFGTFGNWRTDISDAYFLHVQFASGTFATVRIELYRKQPVRVASLSGVEASYRVDFRQNALSISTDDKACWSNLDVRESPRMSSDLERVYAAEIAAFTATVRAEEAYPKTWAEDRHLSDVLVAAELSAREGRRVYIAEVADSYDGLSLE